MLINENRPSKKKLFLWQGFFKFDLLKKKFFYDIKCVHIIWNEN